MELKPEVELEVDLEHELELEVRVIYHYVERLLIVFITPNSLYNIYDYEKKLRIEPVNIRKQS